MDELERLKNKWGLEIIDNRRFYKLDLNDDNYEAKNTLPMLLRYKDQYYHIEKWNDLVATIVELIIEDYNPTKLDLIAFQLAKSNIRMFCEGLTYKGHFLDNGLSVKMDQNPRINLMAFKGLVKQFIGDTSIVELYVFKKPIAEPLEAKDYFRNKNMDLFKKYAISKLNKSEEEADKLIEEIDNYRFDFSRYNEAFEEFFLFDSSTLYRRYVVLFLKEYLLNKNISKEKYNHVLEVLMNYKAFIDETYNDYEEE